MPTCTQQAILLACWEVTDPKLQAMEIDIVRTAVASRPMVQRAVEQLVDAGCVNITIVCSNQSYSCEQLLGKGERFGVVLRYLTIQSDTYPLARLAEIIASGDEPICIASAMNIPDCKLLQSAMSQRYTYRSKILCTQAASTLHWTGWGVLTREQAMQLIPPTRDEQDLAMRVLAMPGLRHTICANVLTLSSADAALVSLNALLKKDHPGGVVIERAHLHGVWIGPGSVIDPSATLRPPVYIGHQVNVQADACVGPGVILEEGSIIERGAILDRCWVLAHTYVGQQTTLHHCIASANLLINLDHDVLLKINDSLLLGGNTAHHSSPKPPILTERLTALLLWLMLCPLVYLLCRRLKRLPVAHPVSDHGVAFPDRMANDFVSKPTALIPATQLIRENTSHALALHFLNTFHPGLRDIFRKRVRLIGIEPHTLPEVEKLPPYWRHLYARASVGLINETLLLGEEAADPLLCFAGDALAANSMTLSRATRLLLRYTSSVLTSTFSTELSPSDET